MAERKMPVRTHDFALDGDWEGWKFSARTNPTMGIFFEVASGDMERLTKGMASVITKWNFVDEDGKPLPEPNLDVIKQYVPIELMTKVANAWIGELANLPPA